MAVDYTPILWQNYCSIPEVSPYFQSLDCATCLSAEQLSDTSSSKDFDNFPNLVANTNSENFSMQETCLQGDGVESESLHVLRGSSYYQSADVSLLLPLDGMQIDKQLSILHLLKAYGEAMEMEVSDLADLIIKRLKEKTCPMVGSIWERLAYYLAQALDPQVESYLREEAGMNYEIAFNVFYQMFPYGRFAHFTANSVILDSIPENAKIMHIVDLDVGTGIQWPPLMEAIAMRGTKLLRLTTIKWEEDDDDEERFEFTKLLLYEYGRSCGLRLKVEEINLESLASKMKETKRSDFLAFNCMVGLPHMNIRRNVKSVIQFLKLAKDSINLSSNNGERGIITFGDGIGLGKGNKGKTRLGYDSIFEGQLSQLKILLQSLDTHFPNHLREARIAIECLFLVPYISSLIDMNMWKHIGREIKALAELGLEPLSIRRENLVEAKELVSEGESFFWVNFEGEMLNQMVLGYMETPLVKVSCWR